MKKKITDLIFNLRNRNRGLNLLFLKIGHIFEKKKYKPFESQL